MIRPADLPGTAPHPGSAGQIERSPADIRGRAVDVRIGRHVVDPRLRFKHDRPATDVDPPALVGASQKGDPRQLVVHGGLDRRGDRVSGKGRRDGGNRRGGERAGLRRIDVLIDEGQPQVLVGKLRAPSPVTARSVAEEPQLCHGSKGGERVVKRRGRPARGARGDQRRTAVDVGRGRAGKCLIDFDRVETPAQPHEPTGTERADLRRAAVHPNGVALRLRGRGLFLHPRYLGGVILRPCRGAAGQQAQQPAKSYVRQDSPPHQRKQGVRIAAGRKSPPAHPRFLASVVRGGSRKCQQSAPALPPNDCAGARRPVRINFETREARL